MRPIVILLALLLGGILSAAAEPAAASDLRLSRESPSRAAPWRFNAPRTELPFPHSARAQSVWASGACWTECGSYCAWGMAGCLERDAQGLCLKLTDKCDRYCQRQCRTSGGPLLPIEFFWD